LRKKDSNSVSRRTFLKASGAASAVLALGGCGFREKFFSSNDAVKEFIQRNFKEMSPEEIEEVRQRLLKQYKKKYGRDFVLGTEPPYPNVVFAYGLDLSRCIGCRRCVYACVQENNQSRRPEIQWIRVLRFKKGSMNFEESDHYYDPRMVPEEGYNSQRGDKSKSSLPGKPAANAGGSGKMHLLRTAYPKRALPCLCRGLSGWCEKIR
jgi:molybdopterin-containing oxidoreductase family iron-sulfur binding subunit